MAREKFIRSRLGVSEIICEAGERAGGKSSKGEVSERERDGSVAVVLEEG